MNLPDFRGTGKNFSKLTSKFKTDMPLFSEMRNIGFNNEYIFSFTTIGVTIWAVLIWLFVSRYQKIDDTTAVTNTDDVKNITIIILSFHILTMVFSVMEGYHLSKYVFLTWLTVALSLTATLLNASVVGSLISGSKPYDNPNVTQDVASLILQCFANALMFAYLIHIIRNKRKTMY